MNRTRTRHAAAGAAILAALALCIAGAALLTPGTSTRSTLEQAVLSCADRPSGEIADCLEEPLAKAEAELGARAALDIYERAIPGHAQLAAACHFVAHRLGQQAYTHEGAEALNASIADCDLGYYHGVLKGMAESDPTQNGADLLAQACAQFTDATSWQAVMCRHSLGHNIGSEALPIDQYARLCEELDPGHTDCLGGAVMEQHMSGSYSPDMSPSKLRDCAQLPQSAQQHECVLYLVSWGIMRSASTDLPKAAQVWLEGCHLHAPRTAATCEFATGLGIGAHAYYDVDVTEQTAWAKATCRTGDCGMGFGIGLARPLGDAPRAADACTALAGDMAQGCLKGVDDYLAEMRG